jgi:glycosyltransferase involved in cell wall biosynthesis
MMDFICSRASSIIANSEATYNSIPVRYDHKKRTIYNGVDLSAILDSYVTVMKSPLRIVTVGRLEAVKNQSVLLKAMKLLSQQGVDASLTIVGDGKLQAALACEVEDLEITELVSLVGFKPREVVYEMLPKYDLFVISSHVEGFCNSLVEGIASGLIAVVSDIPIFRELYDESMVYYFDKDKPADLARVIKACSQAPETAMAMAQKANLHVQQHYSLVASVQQHIELYKA